MNLFFNFKKMYVERMKCEQLDTLMAESRKRKTRRGKKNSLKRTGMSCEKGQLRRFRNVLPATKSNKRHSLRPAASPPAPSNTTQFLIEDREEITFFDKSPSQLLPLDEISFYDNDRTCKDMNLNEGSQDSYYEPLWIDDADDEFMMNEFEKDYNAANNLETFSLSRLNEDFSKEELVKRIMDLENQCSETRLNRTVARKSSNSYGKLITDLKTENVRLKGENQQLRSALLQ